MGLESLEKIETIPINEVVDDKLEPLADSSNECVESASLEDVENLQSRYEGAEFVTDLEMSESIADYLENVEEIKYLPEKTLGYQSAPEHKIVLNSIYVGSSAPNIHKEVINTIIHEGRHAYQHYNVDVKCIHESGAEVETWRENFYDSQYQYYRSTGQRIVIPYNDGSLHDVDFRLYYYQPVEIDARNFADDVMKRLEEKGIV